MKVEKAGCILVDTKNKKIGLIFRSNRNDYSFPKGHKEEGEYLKECAIRETAEETKRDCILCQDEPVAKEHYFDSKNDEVDTYYFLAIDNGESNNTSTDTHDLIWTDFDDVEDKLSYESLKNTWRKVKDLVLDLFENN